MSYFVYCSVDARPCPDQAQAVMAQPSVDDYAALGLTGASLSTAVTLGFGIVFSFAILGLVAGSVIKLIRQL